MRYFLLSTNRLLLLSHRILRNYLKWELAPTFLLSADLNFPSRLHHHLALTSAGRGDGEGGREDPPVEPEPNPFTDLTPTDSAEDPFGTDHQIGANIDHLERATGFVIDPGVSF
jgi:hypothetical protein